VAIASDIDELGHLDSRTEHAVAASLWKGGAAAAYVIFQSETRVQPGIGPAPLPATLVPYAGIVAPLGLQALNRGPNEGGMSSSVARMLR
jgi:hypothetical protein